MDVRLLTAETIEWDAFVRARRFERSSGWKEAA